MAWWEQNPGPPENTNEDKGNTVWLISARQSPITKHHFTEIWTPRVEEVEEGRKQQLELDMEQQTGSK